MEREVDAVHGADHTADPSPERIDQATADGEVDLDTGQPDQHLAGRPIDLGDGRFELGHQATSVVVTPIAFGGGVVTGTPSLPGG
jgi:hypothetical protein